MKIKISGYKNIESLEMYIDDYKINMLFGMSGSGKSSIAEALQKKDLEENCTLGKNIKQEILINGEENSSNVLIYNNEIVRVISVSYLLMNPMNCYRTSVSVRLRGVGEKRKLGII
ncbi:MAG: hypothetical protein IJK53_02410 [Erysipelotrichaceae bacterium]|nr:hypothetical protein [Erysipelotrichaceae bacterium]